MRGIRFRKRWLALVAVLAVAVLAVGVSSAAAAGGPAVDQITNAGLSAAFTIGTSQPNELILITADGWPCPGGQQVTVDGSAATLIAAAGDCITNNTGGATVFQFVAPTAGTHNVAIVDEGGFDPLFSNYAVSLLNASSTGITSTSFLGDAPGSITTSQSNEYVFATSVVNNGFGDGTVSWTGSPVTPTMLASSGICAGSFCGIDTSIAGFSAPTPGSYSASMSDTEPGEQVTILVAVPGSAVGAALDALLADVTGVGPGKSLANKVKQIQSYVNANDIADACGAFVGFINEVKAQTGKKITAAQAASFISQAQAIQDTLGC
jgi:hypothetical protein